MSEKSRIAWTNATWNPVTGCSKVSPGCKHCYAERDWHRFHGRQEVTIEIAHGPIGDGRRITEVRGPRPFTHVLTHPERLEVPLRWKRPRLIFVNSMSDLFHEAVPDSFIDRVFAVMALSPQHTYQILTKRPERMRAWFDPGHDNREHAVGETMRLLTQGRDPGLPEWPLRNIWLGVSAENQETADERIPLLLETPAAVRWLSAEPLLSPVSFEEVPVGMFGPLRPYGGRGPDTPGLDWVVVGGESGPHAREMRGEWVRTMLTQCQEARVPFFMKQLGAAYSDPSNGIAGAALAEPPDMRALIRHRLRSRSGADPAEWPADLQVREFPGILADRSFIQEPKSKICVDAITR